MAGMSVLHIGGLTALGRIAPGPDRQGGEAPVINLTLEPSPRFDSPSPAAEADAAAVAVARKTVARPSDSLAREALLPIDRPVELIRQIEPAPAPDRTRDVPDEVEAPAAAARPTSRDSAAGATTGGGGQTLGAAAAPDQDDYAARVLAWIEAHKRAPAGVTTGVVTVRFVLDRRGAVRDLRLARSGGSRALDQAALDQIRTTQPFPRPDPGVTWRTRPFTVRIDYRRGAAG